MTTDLQNTLNGLKDELQDWITNNPDTEPHDYIFELADGGVPVYNCDILSWALENLNFAVDEPENGPGYDGSPTPINIIVANIFEYLEQELWDFYNEHKDDRMCDNCKSIYSEDELTECPNCDRLYCNECLDVCYPEDEDHCNLCED